MGARGPKTEPAHLKLLKGNPGKRALDLDAGINPLVEIPTCPGHINEDGKKEWRRITVELLPLGLVSKIDRAMLALYCHAYGRWVHAELKIRELDKVAPDSGLKQNSPNGYEQISMWVIIANKAMEQVHKYASEFGLSPSARSGVMASANQGSEGQTPTLPGVPEAPKRPTLASFNPSR